MLGYYETYVCFKNLDKEYTRRVRNEKNIKDGLFKDKTNNMTRYYRTRAEAESHRRKGERIYYEPGYGYYIVRPKKRSWWDIF